MPGSCCYPEIWQIAQSRIYVWTCVARALQHLKPPAKHFAVMNSALLSFCRFPTYLFFFWIKDHPSECSSSFFFPLKILTLLNKDFMKAVISVGLLLCLSTPSPMDLLMCLCSGSMDWLSSLQDCSHICCSNRPWSRSAGMHVHTHKHTRTQHAKCKPCSDMYWQGEVLQKEVWPPANQ